MRFFEVSKKKFLLCLLTVFFLLTFVHIIFAAEVQRGLVFDGTWWFARALDSFSSGNFFFEHSWGHRPRGFINILNEIPMNVGFFLLSAESKNILSKLFTLPLFLFPPLFLFFNYLLFRRSKRFEFLLLNFILYGLIIIPTQSWAIVEMPLAASLWLLLFHYLAAKINYTKFDIAIILFISVVLCNAWEESVILTPIVICASLYYAKNEENIKNKHIKYFIALNSLLIALFNITFFVYFLGADTVNEIIRCAKDLFIFNAYFTSLSPYTFVSCLALIFGLIVLKKKRIKSSLYFMFGIIFVFLFFVVFMKPFYIRSLILNFASNRNFMYIIFPLFLIIPVILDYKKINLKRKISSLMVIVLFSSIINTCFGVYLSFLFEKEKDFLKNYINSSSEQLVMPPSEFPSYKLKHANNFFWSTTYPYFTFLFFEKDECSKLYLYGSEEEGKNRYFYLSDTNRNIICTNIDDTVTKPILQCVSIKNKYWDFSDIDKSRFKHF